MRFSRTVTLLAFVALIASSPAFAQAPATTTKPVASDARKAVSKACSDQANAQGLHGKKRKAFRSNCKRHGGKAA
jgi:hypothetical protein